MNQWASTNLCQEAYCVEHTDQALLRNHLLLSTVVAMLTIYSSISLMFPTSSCAVPLKYMVSSKKIHVCTRRDNYVWHQISGKTIARSSHCSKLRCKNISLLVPSQFQCFITAPGVDFCFSFTCSSPSSLGSITDKLRLQCKIWHVNQGAQVQY